MMYRCLKEDFIYFENCVDFFSWLVFWFPNARNLVNSGAEMNRCYKYIVILVYLFKYLY